MHRNKAVISAIVALSFCFNAFAQEATGKDWTEEEWNKKKGRYGWVFPHIDKDADGTVTAAEYEVFQKYKKKHPNWETEFDPDASYDTKREIWKISGKIVRTRNITQSAIGDKRGLWTTVLAGAIFTF